MNDDDPIVPMSRDLDELRAEHRALDARINTMVAGGDGDQLEVARLKKRKLWLKDRIAMLVDSSIPDIIA